MSLISKSSRRLPVTSSRRSCLKSASGQMSRDSSISRHVVLNATPSVSSCQVQDDDVAVRCNDPCGYGPNFYEKMFGPTADETILVGIQTVIRLCGDCSAPHGDRSSSRSASSRSGSCLPEADLDEEDLEFEDNSDDDEEEEPTSQKPGCSIFKSGSKSDSQPSSQGCSQPESQLDSRVSCQRCSKPSSQLSSQRYCSKPESQTDPCHATKSRSNTKDLKVSNESQTDCKTNTKCAQTETKFPCTEGKTYVCCPAFCCHRQDRCICTDPSTPPRSHCPKACKSAQYSRSCASKGCGRETSDSCCCCVGTESEESPPYCCCSTTPSSKSKSKIKSSLKASSCSCCRTTLDATTTSTKRCTCSSSASKEQKQVTLHCECSASSSPSTDDGVGKGMGDTNEVTIRYAVTKITKFFSYTTFEVMKSTCKKPKFMPKTMEGVFVLKNCTCKNS